jgi:hypothetical protein
MKKLRQIQRSYSSTHKFVQEKLRPLGNGTVQVKYHRHLPIALVLLQNIQNKNAMSGKMIAELSDWYVNLIFLGATTVPTRYHDDHLPSNPCRPAMCLNKNLFVAI